MSVCGQDHGTRPVTDPAFGGQRSIRHFDSCVCQQVGSGLTARPGVFWTAGGRRPRPRRLATGGAIAARSRHTGVGPAPHRAASRFARRPCHGQRTDVRRRLGPGVAPRPIASRQMARLRRPIGIGAVQGNNIAARGGAYAGAGGAPASWQFAREYSPGYPEAPHLRER